MCVNILSLLPWPSVCRMLLVFPLLCHSHSYLVWETPRKEWGRCSLLFEANAALRIWLVDGDAPQWTQFHGWLGTNSEQCKWWDHLKFCFLSFSHFSDGGTHGMQRLSEVCNRPPKAAAVKLSTQPRGVAAVHGRWPVEICHQGWSWHILSRLSQPFQF